MINLKLIVMKKFVLACLLLVFTTTFYAQETKVGKAVDKAAVKTKKAAKDVKEGTKKTANKVADKTKKAAKDVKEGTVKTADKVADKSKMVAKDVKAGTKKTAAKVADKTASTADKVEKKAKKTATKIRESNEKAPKTADKVTGTYNGKKVYTGPRGGRYYINSNGNKTYLSEDK
jgi:colicin import membrane protein